MMATMAMMVMRTKHTLTRQMYTIAHRNATQRTTDAKLLANAFALAQTMASRRARRAARGDADKSCCCSTTKLARDDERARVQHVAR